MTNFQRSLFATGFSYTVFSTAELIRFLVDYYVPGMSLQHYDLRPGKSLLFYAVFGHGQAAEGQLGLLATDLRFFYLMFGALLGGSIVLCFYERRSRLANDGKGLFDGDSRPVCGSQKRLRSFADALRTELYVWEYALWWLLRVAMLLASLRKYRRDPSDFSAVILLMNTGVTFLIPLFRLVGARLPFFGKLPLRLQSCINTVVFAGSFLSHGCDLNVRIDNFDKMLHMFTGGACVIIGYVLIRSTRKSEELSPGVCVAAAGGFSFMVGIAWEVFEFFADFYMKDSRNQAWDYTLGENDLFVMIFGAGAENPGQRAVIDTDLDLLGHYAVCVAAMIALYAVLRVRASRNKDLPVTE